MTSEMKLFEATIKNLLAMPAIQQKELARRGRRKRLLRKIENTELDHLIAICEAMNPNANLGKEIWDKLAERILEVFSTGTTIEAIVSCLEELRSYRNARNAQLSATSSVSEKAP